LERHHCHTTMSILNKKNNFKVLYHFTKDEKRRKRKSKEKGPKGRRERVNFESKSPTVTFDVQRKERID
jgi:hypothetical protein